MMNNKIDEQARNLKKKKKKKRKREINEKKYKVIEPKQQQ